MNEFIPHYFHERKYSKTFNSRFYGALHINVALKYVQSYTFSYSAFSGDTSLTVSVSVI